MTSLWVIFTSNVDDMELGIAITNQAAQVPSPKRIRIPMHVIVTASARIYQYLEAATIASALVKRMATPMLQMAASKVALSFFA